MPSHCAEPSALSIENLFHAFENHELFHDFSFHLKPGQWTSLLGASGVGKSTLLRFILGLAQPQAGTITMPSHQRIAYMPQQEALFPWLSVLDNVQLAAHLKGQKSASSRERAEALLEAVGLKPHLKQPVYSLSGGQKQRLALARTLMQDADIVLMDEPFSAVDAITRVHVQQLAQQLLRHHTVLLITHDLQEALRLSDVIYVLRGRPAQLATPLELSATQDLSERLRLHEALWQRLQEEA